MLRNGSLHEEKTHQVVVVHKIVDQEMSLTVLACYYLSSEEQISSHRMKNTKSNSCLDDLPHNFKPQCRTSSITIPRKQPNRALDGEEEEDEEKVPQGRKMSDGFTRTRRRHIDRYPYLGITKKKKVFSVCLWKSQRKRWWRGVGGAPF